MKKGGILIAVVLLLFVMAGCSNPTDPVELSVSDLNDILDTLDLTAASLTYHNDTEEMYPASAAIHAESYIEKLKNFTWKEYTPASELNENDAYFYRLTDSNVTITAFSERHDGARPLHLITADGEGWFILPFIQDEENESTVQVSSMILDVFSSWYNESKAALLCGGTGTPLTA